MNTSKITYQTTLNGVPFILETGEIANLAQSSFFVTYGETVVLVIVSIGKANDELDFFPLSVDYQERLYAAGLISSSPYIKREGKPTDHEILSGRLIDHAIRSLFPADFRNDVQVIAQVFAYDKKHDPVLAAINGVSLALEYSGAPLISVYGATKLGYVNNELVINPDMDLADNALTMYVSSVESGDIVSVEAEAHDLSEEIIKEGIKLAVVENNKFIQAQKEFLQNNPKKAFSYQNVQSNESIYEEITKLIEAKASEVIYLASKAERETALNLLKEQVKSAFESRIKAEEISELKLNALVEKLFKKIVRKNILESGKRPDGRDLVTVRPLSMRVGVLPRVHGSALFTRGETQTLSIVTLGTERDAQQMQNLEGDVTKRYFHHYNMPGYANGEVDRRFGFSNRRAIGHGTIGEKALENMVASKEEFPYAIRVVSEVTSSNGSTSMAATCSSTLALMDAGVPVKKMIGAIGVGLVYENAENYEILTDIIGMEDFYGDMDFKITGSKDGITAIQLDNKMSGIPMNILFEAIDRSKNARLQVIDKMEQCLSSSRSNLSEFAPRVEMVQIDPEKIGELIGPGGKTIKNIIEKTGVEINIEDDGRVNIYSKSDEGFQLALQMINLKVKGLDLGTICKAKIIRVESFGAIIEVENTDIQGMLHVSKLGMGFVKDAKEVLKLGQELTVKLIEKGEKGRMSFELVKE